jgi:hypothetical protein
MQEGCTVLVELKYVNYGRRKVRRPDSGSGHKCKRRTDIVTGLTCDSNELMWLITCYSFELCEEAMFIISKEKSDFFNI